MPAGLLRLIIITMCPQMAAQVRNRELHFIISDGLVSFSRSPRRLTIKSNYLGALIQQVHFQYWWHHQSGIKNPTLNGVKLFNKTYDISFRIWLQCCWGWSPAPHYHYCPPLLLHLPSSAGPFDLFGLSESYFRSNKLLLSEGYYETPCTLDHEM